MIAGAAKSGTTSIKANLAEHPRIVAHPQMEFGYFQDPREYKRGFNYAWNKYFDRYRAPDGKLMMAKNAGLMYNREAIIRLRDHNPRCRIILILRDPVDRTYSSFLHSVANGAQEAAPFDTYIREVVARKTLPDYRIHVERSAYASYLSDLFEMFPREQIHIMLFEHFKEDSMRAIHQVCNFLDISSDTLSGAPRRHNETKAVRSATYARVIRYVLNERNPVKQMVREILPHRTALHLAEALRKSNRTGSRPKPLSQPSRRFLQDFFESHNEDLESLLQLDLSCWRKPWNASTEAV